MEEYIGIVKVFAGNFAPRGWAFCNGQIMSISQNTALFSILGTTYGGNGQTTFALPNLQGAVAIGAGTGGGGTYVLGQSAGTPNVSILTSNLPAHTHTATSVLKVNNDNSATLTTVPSSSTSIGQAKDINTDKVTIYSTGAADVPLASSSVTTTVAATGSNIPISIMQPYVTLSYIICLEGIFPSRN